eukprot:11731755-Ditylum_brightwellii.AAC.1
MATQHCCQMLVPLSWSQNQEMALMTQGVCSAGKTAAGNVAPCVISALRAQCWWGRWWGRRGRNDGAAK